jgi:hypothetical protein
MTKMALAALLLAGASTRGDAGTYAIWIDDTRAPLTKPHCAPNGWPNQYRTSDPERAREQARGLLYRLMVCKDIPAEPYQRERAEIAATKFEPVCRKTWAFGSDPRLMVRVAFWIEEGCP